MTEQVVLVVDPDGKARRMVKGWLRGAGWRVLEAATGLQALAVCACRRVDLVLAELELAGIRGGELAAALVERFPAVVILGMSAQPPVRPPDGVSEVIGKPLDAETLLARIRQRLAAPPKKQAASAAPALGRVRRQS